MSYSYMGGTSHLWQCRVSVAEGMNRRGTGWGKVRNFRQVKTQLKDKGLNFQKSSNHKKYIIIAMMG